MKTIKKYFCLMLLFISPLFIQAQWITGIVVSPPNPTTTDTIHVYASCEFPSGTCNEHTQTIYYSANDISASALHCIGILTYICSATDTFIIPPLAAGTYNFTFHVDAGGLPSPCTPGIVPGPTDSIQFTVTTATGLPPENKFSNRYQIIPGAHQGNFILKFPKNQSTLIPVTVTIYSATGKKIKMFHEISDEGTLDLTAFAGGLYFAQINDLIPLTFIK